MFTQLPKIESLLKKTYAMSFSDLLICGIAIIFTLFFFLYIAALLQSKFLKSLDESCISKKFFAIVTGSVEILAISI